MIVYILFWAMLFIFLIVIKWLHQLERDISMINDRINGIRERIDTMRDMIMQRLENEIRKITNAG
jgi:hypothetical protein